MAYNKRNVTRPTCRWCGEPTGDISETRMFQGKRLHERCVEEMERIENVYNSTHEKTLNVAATIA